jgi:hypothetical protein
MALASMLCVPGYIVVAVLRGHGSLKEVGVKAIQVWQILSIAFC